MFKVACKSLEKNTQDLDVSMFTIPSILVANA